MSREQDFDALVGCTKTMFDSLEIKATDEQIIKIAGWVNLLMEITSQTIQQKIIQYIKTGSDEIDRPVEN